MSVGLIALLDDVAAIAKVAAASLDDVVAQGTQAGVKAAGVVIDDAAVTPRYVVGFAGSRELPIVAKIALGSLRNKLLFLTPAALVLSAFAPGAITPLLMAGGAYLCFEGTEKLAEKAFPHVTHEAEKVAAPGAADAQALENQKVAGAIRTDFILSAEIMVITLAAVPRGCVVDAGDGIDLRWDRHHSWRLRCSRPDREGRRWRGGFGAKLVTFYLGRACACHWLVTRQVHAWIPDLSGRARYSRHDLRGRWHNRPRLGGLRLQRDSPSHS